MTKPFAGIAVATMLSVGVSLAAYAEDVAKDSNDTAAPAAAAPAPTEAPVSVPRPSIVPKTAAPATPAEPAKTAAPAKTAQPAAAPATTEAAPRRYRRHAHRHYYRRYAFWSPFPIYLPRIRGHNIYWSRVSWFRF